MSNAGAPLVSVLMPVRDGGAWLRAAVESIYAQSFTRFELLLVDDGSTDAAIVQLPCDPRLRIAPNRGTGIVDALNTAVSLARAPLLARMDADDIALPDRLAKQHAYLLANPGVAICGGEVEIFRTDGPLAAGYDAYQSWVNALRNPSRIAREMFVESPLPHPTFFAATAVFRQLRYRDCAWAEDYDFLLRAYLAGLRMGKPTGVLLHWRDHQHRLTRASERYSTHNFLRAKAWALSRLYPERPMIICGTGRNAVRLHDALAEHGISVTGFVEHAAARPRTSRRHLKVYDYTRLLAEHKDELSVSAVSARGARSELRALFLQHAMTEGRDFVMAG